MLLYADEDFPHPAVEALRNLGHDIITAQDDGHDATPDPEVLARAHTLGRVILTYNRRHYERLHRLGSDHSGIVSATQDTDHGGLAARVHGALISLVPGRWCIRVNRPAKH